MANQAGYDRIETLHPSRGSSESSTWFELLGVRLKPGDQILVKTNQRDIPAIVDGACRYLLVDGPVSRNGERESVPVWKDELEAEPMEPAGWGILLPGPDGMRCRWP